jgi:uncharacterized glyoxalase superfamily protein PhnB
MLSNRSMPRAAVIPVLAYPDVAEAAAWLCETFGFKQRWRAGGHRAQLGIGDAAVALTAGTPGESSGSVMVRVEDVDAHHERARERGARTLDSPTDYPYGERQYTAEDLAGYRWTFSQSIADVAPEDWGGSSG